MHFNLTYLANIVLHGSRAIRTGFADRSGTLIDFMTHWRSRALLLLVTAAQLIINY